MRRIESLDYLRGLMAFSILIYHYITFSYTTLDSEYLLGKLGIYAVSIFYILSGLSLAIVYKNKPYSKTTIIDFWIKRIFRIVPLFALATSAAILVKILQAENVFTLFYCKLFILNYTLLFGFIRPDAYIATGGWSIGNEMVFYSLFPLLLYLWNKNKNYLYYFLAFSFGIYLYFAFFKLHANQYLASQWGLYINPFNQLFLFVSGVAIGLVHSPMKHSFKNSSWLFMLFIISTCFTLYPAHGDKINLITGHTRLFLTSFCILGCFIIYLSDLSFNNKLGSVLNFLGKTSYSIYLLHPIILDLVRLLIENKSLSILISVIATLMISYLTYTYIEKPMINLGRTIKTIKAI